MDRQQEAMKSYAEIKEQCLREKKLFEDPDFPADDSSVLSSAPDIETTRQVMGHQASELQPSGWKRPGVSNVMQCKVFGNAARLQKM